MKKQSCYRMNIVISIIAVVMVAITFFGCDAKKEQDQKSLSISEYLEETNENWFLTGKSCPAMDL